MKKLSIALALLLCLVLCVFAFASCGKKKTPADTTAASTTAAQHVHDWETDFTVDKEATCTAVGSKSIHCKTCNEKKDVTPIEKKAHTPSEDYKEVTPPTCTDDGLEAKYCTVCQTVLEGEGMTRAIPAVGGNHVVAEDGWTVIEATLLKDGSKTGTCTKCGVEVKETLTSEPIVYLTNWDDATRKANPNSILNPDYKNNSPDTHYIFSIKSNVTKLRGSDGHFYPDASNENQGNDLLVEFSFLYNDTVAANASDDGTLAVMYIENNNVFNINLKTGKITAKIRSSGEGGPDEYLYELPGIASHQVPIGEYGWHRFGMRISQTATNNEGEVQYSVIATAYLDGVKIFEVDKTKYALSKHNNNTANSGLLYTATIENDELVYHDLDADGHFCDVYIMVEEIFNNKNDPNPGYVVVGDVAMACGKTFKQDVMGLTDPIEKTLVVDDKGTDDVADDVEVPASFYYWTTHEHDDVADLAWTIIEEPGTLLSGAADGLQKKYCTVCGEALASETIQGITVEKYTTEHREAVVLKHTFADLLAGGKHFYPDESNGNLGNDVIIEYSLLWNHTLGNLSRAGNEKKWQVISQRICGQNDGAENDLIWMSLCDNCGGSSCPYAGGFEYGGLRTVEVGPATMSTPDPASPTYDNYPNIGGEDRDNPEWGWHHVQIRLHEEITNADALKADTEAKATAAVYRVYTECYVDGVLLFRLSNAPTTVNGDSTLPKKNYLYTAESDGEGGINYTEVKDKGYILGLRVPSYYTDSGVAYLVYADYKCFVGTAFTQNVKKVETPVEAQFEVEAGVNLTSTMFFEANSD